MLNTHNPIGFTVSDSIKQRIAALLHEYKVYLIEDDAYAELNYDHHKPLPMSYFISTKECCIVPLFQRL